MATKQSINDYRKLDCFASLAMTNLPGLQMFRRFIFLSLLLIPAPLLAQGAVTSADPRATEAGQEILRAGGSATDAAIAMMLALTVVEPQSSGIGGGGFLVHHSAGDARPETIDGRETAPASASPQLFMDTAGKPLGFRDAVPGGRSAGIPGNIALAAEAHRQWGVLPWAALFTPAIRLAEEGYTVNRLQAAALARVAPLWADFPETRAIYWENGAPKAEGARVVNPALGAFYRRMAAEGSVAFYTGQNADAVASAITSAPRNPVPMATDELGRYTSKQRDPVCGRYRAYRICGMGPPSSGGVTVLQILGMVERFDLGRWGKDDPRSWHVIGEAMKLAYADREQYLADPDFISVPTAGLIDRRYLARRSRLIRPDRALSSYNAGTPRGAPRRTAAISGEAHGTTHFIAVDEAGNIASYTSTIEGPFGNQMVVNGYFLNNELTDFTFAPMKDGAMVANAPAAGKRPLSSMAPVIVYDQRGRAVFTAGAAGGKRIIMQVAKTLIARLDWGMSAADAVAAPNIYFNGTTLLIEGETPAAALEARIEALGQTVEISEPRTGKANAAERLPDGSWRGAADPRSLGTALSE